MENQQQASLTIADLIFVKQLLEVVSKRGVFNAEELTTVGAFYDKLSSFLTATEAQAQAQAQANAPVSENSESTTETPADSQGE